jgi:hypothetical protein
MSKKYQFGNAFSDVNKRQWLVGSFIEPKEDIRSTKDVEVD